MGALPTLYAAAADIPGGTYIGPSGFRVLPRLPGLRHARSAGSRRHKGPPPVGALQQLTGVSWPLSPLTSS